MTKFNRILVALSHSDEAEVFDRALDLAKATGAKLMILHVLSPADRGSPVMSIYPTTHQHYTHLNPKINRAARLHYQEESKAVEQEITNWLRSLVSLATDAGVAAESIQVYGSPSRTICQVAQSSQADLIVIGRNNSLTDWQEVIIGSVSNYVVHHASTSVLVVDCHRVKPQPNNAILNNNQTDELI